MRDPYRINYYCNELAKLWHKVPDWRFGQFILNMERACRVNTGRDVFYLEDDEFFKFMHEYFKGVKVKVGDKVRIIIMQGEPQYTGKVGTVEYIDDAGQIHGSWGGCALIPDEDVWELLDNN